MLEKFVPVGENVLKNYACKINHGCLLHSRSIRITLWTWLTYAFEWILKNNYNLPNLMHYLDDYFTVGPSNSDVFANNIQVQVASRLEIPLASDTLEGLTVPD